MACTFRVYEERTFGLAIYLLRRHHRRFGFKCSPEKSSSLVAFLLAFTDSISCRHIKLPCCSLVAYFLPSSAHSGSIRNDIRTSDLSAEIYTIGNLALNALQEIELAYLLWSCLYILLLSGAIKSPVRSEWIGETCSRHHSVLVARISSLSLSLCYWLISCPCCAISALYTNKKNTLITVEWGLEKFG